MKILHAVGARPNFMKIAPIVKEIERHRNQFEQVLVHTGQHYDEGMSQVFFDSLGLPSPNARLSVGSGSHIRQIAEIMMTFERALSEHNPDLVLVVGDVNSTLACALTSSKMGIPVAHVEAGLRSFDRTMPEEINRVLTDQVASLLFTTEPSANENLRREGVLGNIHFVGNVMIDTLLRYKEQALALNTLEMFELEPFKFILLTLHRPSNVDAPRVLAGILDALDEIQARLPIFFPAHPRTLRQLRQFDLWSRLVAMPNLQLATPLGYLEFLNLMANARLVLTDSGGIQEETTALNVPCLTLRQNTERPITVTEGTNTVIGNGPEQIVIETFAVLDGAPKIGRMPSLWDGNAAKRIVEILQGEASD